MGGTVQSISFHENNVSWVEVEVGASQSATVKKAIESPLPVSINFDNLHKSASAVQIANHLRSLADSHHLGGGETRFLLSARFALVKKILVDQEIPESLYSELARNELNYVFSASTDDYLIYQPQYSREQDALREILTVALRKDLYSFFEEVAREADFTLEKINLNCFTVDNLYHRFFPNLIGQTLLVNFAERGLEIVISDQRDFLDFRFKPYSRSLQTIDQFDQNEVVSIFYNMLAELQQPGRLDAPLYSISQVYLFGSFFKSEWLEQFQDNCNLPLRVLNPTDTAEWQIIVDDTNLNTAGTCRFVEALSNIF